MKFKKKSKIFLKWITLLEILTTVYLASRIIIKPKTIILDIRVTNVNSTGWFFNKNQLYAFVAPKNVSEPGRMNFSFYIPETKRNVFLEVCFTQQNNLTCNRCCKDSVVEIFMNKKNVFQDVVFDWNKWKCIYFSLNKYKGKNITFSLYDYAGGVCSKWCGEGVLVNHPRIIIQ